MKTKTLLKLLLVFSLFVFNITLFSPNITFANSFDINKLYFKGEKNYTLKLTNDSKITLYYEPQYENIAKNLGIHLTKIHKDYENLLGIPKDFNLVIKLINQKDFFKITKIPSWINAVYFKKHIIFPIQDGINNFNKEFFKSLRHEYMHAFVNNLSNGTCASWFDEGLAQWAEGEENPKLWSELDKFLKVHNALSLSNLETSYTTLPTYLVPVAYAESLFGIKYLFNETNLENLKKMFTLLRNHYSFSDSFQIAYNLSLQEFDYKIVNTLYNYKESDKKQSFDELINYSKSNNFEYVMARMNEK